MNLLTFAALFLSLNANAQEPLASRILCVPNAKNVINGPIGFNIYPFGVKGLNPKPFLEVLLSDREPMEFEIQALQPAGEKVVILASGLDPIVLTRSANGWEALVGKNPNYSCTNKAL